MFAMERNLQTPLKSTQKENFSQNLLTIPPSPFLDKLGYGTCVNVWKLQPSSNSSTQSPWAIKNVRRNVDSQLSTKYQSLLNQEANILRTLNHEHIIGFRGYLKSSDGRNCLAMEVGGESLGNLIESRLENGMGPYPPGKILKVAYSIAKALKYLHHEKKILHGDLKPFNIVVKNDFDEIKLCDFGVSLSLDDKNIKQKYVGTLIYSAPECQEGIRGPITSKADIFSLGLVMWEMMSLLIPHTQDLLLDNSFFLSQDSENGFDSSGLSDIEQNYGTRPPLPPELGLDYTPVIDVFHACTEQDPEQRPSAAELVDWLEDLVKI